METILDHNKEKPKRRGGKPNAPFLRWLKYYLYSFYWMFFPEDRRVKKFGQLLAPLGIVFLLIGVAVALNGG